MQNTKNNTNRQNTEIINSLTAFFKRFEITKILRQSGIHKVRGVNVRGILQAIIELPFLQQNFYRGIADNDKIGFNKSSAYDLLNNNHYNWRKFLYKVAVTIINRFFKPLTGDNREDVLIIDDTCHLRDRSKKVELLTKVFDHAIGKYFESIN